GRAMFEDGLQQALLVPEVIVHRRHVRAGRCRDAAQRYAVISLLCKQAFADFYQALGSGMGRWMLDGGLRHGKRARAAAAVWCLSARGCGSTQHRGMAAANQSI